MGLVSCSLCHTQHAQELDSDEQSQERDEDQTRNKRKAEAAGVTGDQVGGWMGGSCCGAWRLAAAWWGPGGSHHDGHTAVRRGSLGCAWRRLLGGRGRLLIEGRILESQ